MPTENSGEDKMNVIRPRELRLERRAGGAPRYRSVAAEKPPDLLEWWKVVRKRRWTVVTWFLVLFGAILIGSIEQKPVYRAKALIEIDRESPSVASPQQLFLPDEVTDTYLETQYKVLASDDLAERVIRELGLDRNREFLPAASFWPWRAHTAQAAASPAAVTGPVASSPADPLIREAVLKRFQDRLDIRPVRRSRAVELRFDSQDAELAARTVNAVAENFIQKTIDARLESAQKASEGLARQMQETKAKLEKSENDLEKYAADNNLLYLETSKGDAESIVNQRVRDIQDELTRAEADRYSKESLYRLVQAGDFASLPGVFDNKLLQDLSVRLADLERQRAQLAATFTGDYPRLKETQGQIDEIQSSLERERRRAAQKISNDYFAALRREKLVRQAFAERQLEANQVAEKSVQYGILSREVATNKGLYEGLLERLKEAGASAGLKAANIHVVDPGTVPFKPIAPNYPLNLGLGVVLGLGLGVAIAFLREHLDQTIRYREDVFQYLGIPALGFIPTCNALRGSKPKAVFNGPGAVWRGLASVPARAPGGDSKQQNALAIPPGTAFSEAFRELRTSVILSSSSRFANSILVTSAQPGEGKTTVAVNLALSLAQLGQPVLLVDADMRRPSIQKYFPQPGSHLSSYLAGRGAWQEMVHPTWIDRLHVLESGPIPENPSELLSSDRMRALLKESSLTYRFVILDSPPLLNRADSRVLGSMAAATILVVKGGETPRQVVQYAESQMQSVGANLIGVVLNNLNASQNDYSYYACPRPAAEAGAA